MSKNKILVLGAGYGGVRTAKKLAKKYKKNNDVEITLIDRNPYHTLMTELHEVAGGRVHPESVQVELCKIFGKSKVNVVTDFIEKVDTDNKVVKNTYGEYSYDYLVIGTEYNVDESEVTLKVVEAMGTILNMLDRKQADKAEKYMVKHGMEILKNSPIVEVTENKIVLKSGEKINTRTLIWTCGIQANQDAKEYGLDTARAGRLQTNEFMQAVGKKDVFVVGDMAYFEEEAGKGTPQIVEAAVQTADTVVKNIVASIENKEMQKFQGKYHGFMVSIGGRYCVANLMGLKLSGFFAMIMKHLVNIHYLFDVNDVHAIYSYLQHEFFTMEDRRSVMRGHLSSKANRLWLVPLRLYIGCLWLIEGLKKLLGESTWESMWKADSIGDFFKNITIGADSWTKAGNIKMPFEWLQQATSGASASTETAAEFATPILKEVPGWYAAIMQVMMPNPEVAVWFQRIVVLMEIGMGLCLIAGLFTFIFSAVSAGMVVNFVLCAMAGWDILWFFFGSIALMSGAGRTFGLDYYIMPWITRLADNFWHGKKQPMYKNV